jgi:hypothetical protein
MQAAAAGVPSSSRTLTKLRRAQAACAITTPHRRLRAGQRRRIIFNDDHDDGNSSATGTVSATGTAPDRANTDAGSTTITISTIDTTTSC